MSAPSLLSTSCWQPGNSAIMAIEKMKEMGASDIRFICLFAALEGIEAFKKSASRCRNVIGSIDRGLEWKNAYIRPGVGRCW